MISQDKDLKYRVRMLYDPRIDGIIVCATDLKTGTALGKDLIIPMDPREMVIGRIVMAAYNHDCKDQTVQSLIAHCAQSFIMECVRNAPKLLRTPED